jgi:hypothetical protein
MFENNLMSLSLTLQRPTREVIKRQEKSRVQKTR